MRVDPGETRAASPVDVYAAVDIYADHDRSEPNGRITDCGTSDGLAGVVGASDAMHRVFTQVEQVARGTAPVLIVGETGTGKELIARAIHDRGPRRDAPYVAVNCAALPRELIESELFGYKRGAFSGALTDHLGLVRGANGGTILLDEITEMSPELQAKLLRVVQEQTVRPVGAVAEVPVDVRFIASSNRDLDAALRDGALRPDLYYRLSVGLIALPPLRERGDDVLLLLTHHLEVLNRRYRELSHRYGERPPAERSVSAAAVALLRQRTWPGNVRELFNVLERAFLSSRTPQLDAADLALASPRADDAASAVEAPADPRTTLAENERALLAATLDRTGGNKSHAARELGISRKKLYARIAKYAL